MCYFLMTESPKKKQSLKKKQMRINNALFVMKHTFNTFFLTAVTVLFAGSIIIGKVAIPDEASLFQRESASNVTGIKKQVKGVEVQTDYSKVEDVLFNDAFLNINESIMSTKSVTTADQLEGQISSPLYPPQGVRARDGKTGRLVIITWKRFPIPPHRIEIFKSSVFGKKGEKVASIGG